MNFFQPKSKNNKQKPVPSKKEHAERHKTTTKTIVKSKNTKPKSETNKTSVKPVVPKNSAPNKPKPTHNIKSYKGPAHIKKTTKKPSYTRPQSPQNPVKPVTRALSPQKAPQRQVRPINSPSTVRNPSCKKRKLSPQERISALGLEFVYLQKDRKITSQKKPQLSLIDKKPKKTKEEEQKLKIREYIRRKAALALQQKKAKEMQEKAETERIHSNVQKLGEFVQRKFSPKRGAVKSPSRREVTKSSNEKIHTGNTSKQHTKAKKITKVQAAFRGYLARKHFLRLKGEKTHISINFYGDIKNSKDFVGSINNSANEKVVCLSKINPSYIDEPAPEKATCEVGISTDPVPIFAEPLKTPSKSALEFSFTPTQNLTKPVPLTTPCIKRENNRLFPLTEAKAFDKQSFEQLILQKLKGGTDEAFHEILKARENAVQYKKSLEKRYIKSSCKNAKEYNSKRKELEKWVEKEHTAIAKTRTLIVDAWEKTREIIEGSQRNSEMIKGLLFRNQRAHLSYTNSGTNSMGIRGGSSRAGTFEEVLVVGSSRNKKPTLEPFLDDKVLPTKSLEHKEESSSKIPSIIIDLNTFASRQKRGPDVPLSLDMKLVEKLPSERVPITTDLKEEITTRIYEQLIEDVLAPPLFPIRDIPKDVLNRTAEEKQIDPLQSPHEKLLTKLALIKPSKGIRVDIGTVSDYLDEIFACALSFQKPELMSEVNRPIPRNPSEILKKLQNPTLETMERFPPQLPHEMAPILRLSTYLEGERLQEIYKQELGEKDTPEFLIECDHIHKKAIFDASNEALNLIRPYGFLGQPMLWSGNPRILFTQITCPGIIVTNVKNIVSLNSLIQDQVLDWAGLEAGTLPKKDFVENGKFDLDSFNEIREHKLITLLGQEVLFAGITNYKMKVLDTEQQWLNYEMEETEVKIDIADMIMEKLLGETIDILINIQSTHNFQKVFIKQKYQILLANCPKLPLRLLLLGHLLRLPLLLTPELWHMARFGPVKQRQGPRISSLLLF
eukprot:TRINITY_DN107_c0_g2_i1.p1 TRINITY_DN107_c0_g2~~TRINITY_DN107_c0_g2_i1.p1  ORF type:complete len:1008 (+),score=93.89 TRINITY_DN107_c0_g2_i1:4888-7911(+)